jgi:hypothetical protein
VSNADRAQVRTAAKADLPTAERWQLSPAATAFVRERAQRLNTGPEAILEDLILVERRRVEGAL